MLMSLLRNYLRLQRYKKPSLWYFMPVSFIIGGSIIAGEVFIIDAIYQYVATGFKTLLEGILISLLSGAIFLIQAFLLLLLLKNSSKENENVIGNSFQEFKSIAAAFWQGYSGASKKD